MQMTAGRLQYMLERLSESLTVTAYGAVGIGTIDDAPAIQAALNAAKIRGGWVIVPPGTYLLATLPLRIYRNTRLTLLPGARFVRGAAETMLINGDASQNLGGYTGHGNITIEGGVWDCQGTAPGLTAPAMCISIGHARDITIRDVEIRDVSGYHAIELNSTKRGTIENCRFLGYYDPGARDFSEAVQLDLAKSSGVFGGFGPFDHTSTEDILITGCYFGASGTSNTTAWPRGIGSHSATITKYHRRVRVSDCTFEGVTQYGVSAYNWEDVAVTGCNFSGCGSGVRFRTVILTDTEDTKRPDGTQTGASQAMRNLTVTGNTFRGGSGYDEPIVALGEASGQILNLTIGDNAIDGSTAGQNGIRLQQVQRFAISGNAISSVDGTAVSMENADNGAVTGNHVYTPGGHGLTAVTCTHMSLTGNQVLYPGGNGVLVQDGNNIHIRDSYIKSPGRSVNNTYYGIRLSSTASSISLSGNKVRPNGSGNEAINGFSATNTCSNVARYGNDWRGSEFTGGALDDKSPAPQTLATDLA
ncbi:right-handed parallel beta-helix repeat-containing protein [Streptomyces sp. NPDC058644]|uniref:right-handed parallel beta-helix repeat-containing protein n=1 Tax=unclassified Streptomyces TaxID=2593676 RepID=UPI003663076A